MDWTAILRRPFRHGQRRALPCIEARTNLSRKLGVGRRRDVDGKLRKALRLASAILLYVQDPPRARADHLWKPVPQQADRECEIVVGQVERQRVVLTHQFLPFGPRGSMVSGRQT
jgi:hypothetical protein